MLLGIARASDRDEVGRLGESLVESELKRLGWTVLGRNVRVPMGEADLIARDPEGWFVIVEVKCRVRAGAAASRSNATSPLASITASKRRRLGQIARYLALKNVWPAHLVRVDGASVELRADATGRLTLIEIRMVRKVT